jgi:invasion protein IalB
MSASSRFALRCLVLAGTLALATQGFADTKKEKTKDKDAPTKPALVGTYGDWSVYQSVSGKNRICYALAMPKERAPDDLKRDQGYAFISERPAEHVRNEVSFVMGFDLGGGEPVKDSTESKDKKKSDTKDKKDKKAKTETASPTAIVGDASFDLLPKGSNLWVKNPAEESQLIDQMRKGAGLKIHAASKKGVATVDSYSLSGFSQAIDRALKDCPGS